MKKEIQNCTIPIRMAVALAALTRQTIRIPIQEYTIYNDCTAYKDYEQRVQFHIAQVANRIIKMNNFALTVVAFSLLTHGYSG